MRFRNERDATRASRRKERMMEKTLRRIGSSTRDGFLFRAIGVLEGIRKEDPQVVTRVLGKMKDDIPCIVRDTIMKEVMGF